MPNARGPRRRRNRGRGRQRFGGPGCCVLLVHDPPSAFEAEAFRRLIKAGIRVQRSCSTDEGIARGEACECPVLSIHSVVYSGTGTVETPDDGLYWRIEIDRRVIRGHYEANGVTMPREVVEQFLVGIVSAVKEWRPSVDVTVRPAVIIEDAPIFRTISPALADRIRGDVTEARDRAMIDGAGRFTVTEPVFVPPPSGYQRGASVPIVPADLSPAPTSRRRRGPPAS